MQCLLWTNQSIHAIHRHAVQTLFVKNGTVPAHVCAYRNTLAIRMLDVVQSVCKTRNAIDQRPVLITNARIHAPVYAVSTQVSTLQKI